jgi:hypothetical protein
MRTRGDLLRYSIAYALIRARKIVRGLRQGLTEEERYEVADAAVYELRKHGDPWRLSEPVRDVTGEGPTTPRLKPDNL